MAGDRQQTTDPHTGSPRRRVLTAAALAPLLAAAPAPARARPAPLPHEPITPGGRKLIEPVHTTLADWKKVAKALGRTGDMKRKVMYHTGLPRRDLRVDSHHVRVKAPLALGSHVSFVRYADDSTLVMGDIVVTEHELQDFVDTLQEHRLHLTALHKHLLSQRPDVWWVHVHGHGDEPVAMARGLREAFDGTGTPPDKASDPDEKVDLDTDGIDDAMGAKGSVDDGIYKCIFVRKEKISDGKLVLPPGLGSTSAFNFQPLGHGRAAISADCCMIAKEVPRVLRALRKADAKLVELHNHGLTDEPRLFFVHVWAVGDAVRLARALRHAVDATDVVPAGS
ncbi:DUF1259 domain-containing protein [Streptomyces sp. 769]|uniref:DUF1259 domain-containing protein n=1 Tax=Streptomyces sp. 769 TaxID=1262452 RepID=UPI00057DDE82|nr:DUF1259 domain-containing protein [Streptomyces sp. 769]